jgi:hypothetical protein
MLNQIMGDEQTSHKKLKNKRCCRRQATAVQLTSSLRLTIDNEALPVAMNCICQKQLSTAIRPTSSGDVIDGKI